MTKPSKSKKPTRQQYSPDFRTEALALADRVGVPEAARQLGLESGLIYNWRKALRLTQTSTEAEQRLATENARLKRQLAEQAEELAILKKSGGVLREKPEVKYAFMQAHRDEFTVKAMARVLGVSRSQFYAWRHRQHLPSPRQQERVARARSPLRPARRAMGHRGWSTACGTPAVPLTGTRLPTACADRACTRAAKKFKATTNSRHSLPVTPNLLAQDFTAPAPNHKWVGDITYLWTDEGWIYLATVIDLFSRKVVGWALSGRMATPLVCDAMLMAIWRRGRPCNVIFHSDRGSQYCSNEFQRLLRDHHLRSSMSAKGN